MTGEQLRKSILQEAIQGRLVPNVLQPGEKTGAELLQDILAVRQKKENEEKGKKAKKISLSVIDEEPWGLPEGWCWCKLEDICTITAGQSPDGKDINEQEGVEFHQGKIFFDDLYLKEANIFTKRVTKVAHKGSVLLCMRAPVGIVNITPREICIGRGLSAVDPFKPISSLFLCYWLRGYKEYYEDKATGSTFKAITGDIVKNTPIPIPPLSIQKAVIGKIEELFPLIEEYDKTAEELKSLNEVLPDKLRKSVLQNAICGHLIPQDSSDEPAIELIKRIHKEKVELVKAGKLKKKDLDVDPVSIDEYPFEKPTGWEFARLSEISLDSADGPFGSNLKKEHYTNEKQVRIIQLSNIGEFGWRDSNVKYTTFEHLKTVSRSEAFAGDIIIAKMMPAGRAIICPNNDPKYVLSSDAVRFAFSSVLDKKFLYYAINSPMFKEQVYGEVQGITRVRTSLSKLRTYILPIPPLSEQQRIVAKIEEVFANIDKLPKSEEL